MSPPNRLLGHFLFHIYASTHIHTSPPFRLKQDKGRKISSCMVLKLYDLIFNKFLNQISTDNITFLAVMHETTIIILTFADLCIFLCNALHQKFLKFILEIVFLSLLYADYCPECLEYNSRYTEMPGLMKLTYAIHALKVSN